MRWINNPITALIVLILFCMLAGYSLHHVSPPVVIVPPEKQDGYDAHQTKLMAKFVKFQLAEFQKHENAVNIINIFAPQE